MNERIKLPAQEWLGYDPVKGDMHGYTVDQMKEFVKLIVQECAEVAGCNAHVSGFALGDLIKQHFEVYK